MAVGGQIKGLNFVSARRFAEKYGVWDEVLGRLSPAARARVSESLPIGWYPTEDYVALAEAIDVVLRPRIASPMTSLGTFQAEHDLNVFFRVILRFASPATLITKVAELWGRHHDTGAWEVVPVASGVVMTLTGWRGASEYTCPSITAYMRRLIELVGAKGAAMVHDECSARGGRRCRWTATYR